VGGGVHGRRIGCDGGWTAFVGPTLASPRGRIGAVMSPSDWASCAWISWPLLVAVVGLDFSLLVFRIVWRDLIFALRVPCIGRLRLEAGPRAPAGRLLPQSSAGWDRIAATQRRRLVCQLGAGVLACVVARCGPARGPPWGLLRGGLGFPLASRRKTNRALGLLLPRVSAEIPLSPSLGRAWTALFPCRFLLGLPPLGPRGC